MNINNVAFERSFGISSQLPPSSLPEIAFAGALERGQVIAAEQAVQTARAWRRCPQTPGKTATINFFSCDGVRFVDLPGYGYAKVSKAEKGRWAELIEGYFNQERNLALVVSLVDIRHAASDLDENMIAFLQDAQLPYAVALTKARQAEPPAAEKAEGRAQAAARARRRRAACRVLVGKGRRHRRASRAHRRRRARRRGLALIGPYGRADERVSAPRSEPPASFAPCGLPARARESEYRSPHRARSFLEEHPRCLGVETFLLIA